MITLKQLETGANYTFTQLTEAIRDGDIMHPSNDKRMFGNGDEGYVYKIEDNIFVYVTDGDGENWRIYADEFIKNVKLI